MIERAYMLRLLLPTHREPSTRTRIKKGEAGWRKTSLIVELTQLCSQECIDPAEHISRIDACYVGNA
jgi:hypothetical protein